MVSDLPLRGSALIVRIHEKEGRVERPVPDSVRSLR
jgi:hypothetical protein